MPITEIKLFTRPNTSTPFFSDVAGSLPGYTASRDAVAAYITNGSVTINRAVSEDQLTQTSTITYQDLETFSAVDTLFSLHMDSEFVDHITSNGLETAVASSYSQTGIDQPFTCTVTYSFASGATIIANGQLVNEYLPSVISSSKLTNIDVHDTSVTATFQFNNSADYSTNYWIDIGQVSTLHPAGVTRSLMYSLVTGA
jgi:hypothetical protein